MGDVTAHALSVLSLVCVGLYSPCGHAIDLQYREVDGYTFSWFELRAIQQIADDTTREARQLLPALPPTPVLEVIPSGEVIEELGYSAETGGDTVYWAVRPDSEQGITGIADTHLRPAMLAMFLRMVRAQRLGYGVSIADHLVNAGLEAVFVRDVAAAPYPWATYPPEAGEWAAELLALPANAEHQRWMVQHPDGRRWILIKAGTYLVDQAIRASGRSVMDLAMIPTDEIIEMVLGASVSERRLAQ